MYWGCFSWWGIGPLVRVEGTMDTDAYINTLAEHFVPWANEMAAQHPEHTGTTFQQDNASIHVSNYAKWWMNSHNFDLLEWPACSPDFNPIENLWDIVDSNMRKMESPPKTLDDLNAAVKTEWQKIPLETLRKLIGSMPQRVKAGIKAKGYHTKY